MKHTHDVTVPPHQPPLNASAIVCDAPALPALNAAHIPSKSEKKHAQCKTTKIKLTKL